MLYVWVDPSDQIIDIIDEEFNIESLCDFLRCDSTDLVDLPFGFIGYVDGEGAWQGRQEEWLLAGISYWGPMLILKAIDPETKEPVPCTEEDLELIESQTEFI